MALLPVRVLPRPENDAAGVEHGGRVYRRLDGHIEGDTSAYQLSRLCLKGQIVEFSGTKLLEPPNHRVLRPGSPHA